MRKGYKADRLAGVIQKVIGETLIHKIKDPRFESAMTSVTAVEVTNDGSFATVFLSVLPMGVQNADETVVQNEILEAMQDSKGLFKKEISSHVKVRHLPELIFKIDNSLEYGRHIEELLSKMVK